ncbi:MAG: Dihydrofolate reductase [Myxococcaceae bacterium]|jgi:dihydrofolate reductase|nr:Dihydrofolate reductase [Myxococcaceae bacterium]MEA2747555.1 dihydrofolate reductase [Myxococcales bacterium]
MTAATERTPLAMVVAIGDDGAIGKDGKVPWRIPEDLKHFKNVTMGHAIVMGRKTWDEVGKPLPGRRNIVVSRQPGLALEGAEVFTTLDDAVAAARTTDPEPHIIGGSTIYAAAMPLATRIYLTEVHRVVDADTFFPPFDRSAWREVERRPAETEGVEFVTLER